MSEAGKLLASRYFGLTMNTLHRILPYYDLGGFTAYDLSHLMYHRSPHIGANYHAVYIFLLHALVSITADAQLGHVGKPFERLTFQRRLPTGCQASDVSPAMELPGDEDRVQHRIDVRPSIVRIVSHRSYKSHFVSPACGQILVFLLHGRKSPC